LGHTNRLWIKTFMAQFGEVAQVHKPPSSGNPADDVAFVRFVKDEHADIAMAKLSVGTQLENGTPVIGFWKGQGKGARQSSGVVDYNTPVIDSRTLAEGRSGGGRDRSRGRGGDRGDRGDRGGQRRLHPPNSTVMIKGVSSSTSEHSISKLLRDYGDVQVSLAHVVAG